jgi:hypothetical protein
LHERAGDGDGALQRVARRLAGPLIGEGGEQAVAGGDRDLAGVHQQEAPGSVRALRLAWIEAGLPEQRRLLVAKHARDRHAGHQAARRAEHTGRGHDRGQRRARHAERLQQRLVPRETPQVHQLRAARVGHVGDVQPGEVPEQPGVDGAEQQLPRLRARPRARHGVEQPAQLERAEIARERQPGHVAEPVGPARARQLRH